MINLHNEMHISCISYLLCHETRNSILHEHLKPLEFRLYSQSDILNIAMIRSLYFSHYRNGVRYEDLISITGQVGPAINV